MAQFPYEMIVPQIGSIFPPKCRKCGNFIYDRYDKNRTVYICENCTEDMPDNETDDAATTTDWVSLARGDNKIMNDIREAVGTLYEQSKHLCLACTMPWLGVMFKDMHIINTYLETQTFSRVDFPDEETGGVFMEAACRQKLSMDIFHSSRAVFLCSLHQRQVFPNSPFMSLTIANVDEEVPT